MIYSAFTLKWRKRNTGNGSEKNTDRGAYGMVQKEVGLVRRLHGYDGIKRR